MIKPKQLSFDEVYAKLMKYCAYQERSSFEARGKAYNLGANKQEIEALLKELIAEGFVNDQRFALAYAKGKANQKRWGFYKISEGLYAKGIQGELAKLALEQISEEQHLENLNHWLRYKVEREVYTKENMPKLFRFLASKGFESHQISKLLKAHKLM